MKEWRHYLTIEKVYVLAITDAGKEEQYTNDDELIDSTDLGIALELSGGFKLVLPNNSRILCDHEMMHIQVLI